MFHRFSLPVLVTLIAINFCLVSPRISLAQTAQKSTPAIDYLMEQRIRDFEAWRKDIPDYEKRLYDRLKAVNRRVVSTRGMVAILLIINVLTLAAIIFVARKGGFPFGAGGAVQGAPKIKLNLRRLANRQTDLRRSIDQVRQYVSDSGAGTNDLSELLEILEKEAKALDSKVQEHLEGEKEK